MTCHEIDSRLWAFVRGELPERETTEVRRHTGACWMCQEAMAGVEQLVAAADRLPSPQPAASLLLETKAAVREELERTGKVCADFGPVMAPDDLAKYLKVDVATVYRHLDEIPHFELNGHVRFRRERVDEWLAVCEHRPIVVLRRAVN